MKKLLQVYQNFSRAKQIAVGVVLVHLALLLVLSSHHLITSQLKPPRPMIVKTISPIVKTISPVVAALPVKEKPVSVKAPALQNKSAAAPLPKPQKLIASKPTKKVEHPLSEVAKRLETLGSDTKKKAQVTLAVPKKIEPPPKVEEAVDNIQYEEILIAFLQESLDLPEFGHVRLKLQIDRFGKLIDCQIVEAKSAKNAEFLKNRLPELTFPWLNDFDNLSSTQTFNITFRNVETR